MRIVSEFGASMLERAILVALVSTLAFGASAAAQDSGRIVGTVTESANGAPVAGAQVVVEGTGIGAVSGQRGTYSLPNVPAGARTIVVTMLGFETVREQVDVVKRAAGIMGVPYQTYLKQVVFRQAVEDIERAQVLGKQPRAPKKRKSGAV